MKQNKLRGIALYGGAFDPPHKSHIAIIQEVLHFSFIDEVWLMPCGDRTDKKLVLDMHHRFQLLQKLVVRFGKRVRVIDEEIQLCKQMKRMIDTYELIPMLRERHPDCEFHFVVGGDILTTISTWTGGDYMLNEVKFIIFPRKGFNISEQPMPKEYQLSHYIPEEISSSGIKAALLDQQLSKQVKYEKVNHALEDITIQMLKQQGFL